MEKGYPKKPTLIAILQDRKGFEKRMKIEKPVDIIKIHNPAPFSPALLGNEGKSPEGRNDIINFFYYDKKENCGGSVFTFLIYKEQ